jgi:hypothetical protein
MFKSGKPNKPAKKSGGGAALMQQVYTFDSLVLIFSIFYSLNIDGFSNTKF